MLMERVVTEIAFSVNCACFQCHNINVVPVSIHIMGEVSMGRYLPHINRLFVVFPHCTQSRSRNTTVSQMHTMDAIVPLARDFSSWTWRHWSLRRCQCDESIASCEVATIFITIIFFLIPFYLQAVQIHLANVVKLLLLQT
jgi:hypothetical protein